MDLHVISSRKGFTLIETLIAMLIFAFVLIFMLQGFLLAYKLNYEKLLKDETVKIAQEELERLRSIPFSSVTNSCNGVCNNFDPDSTAGHCLIHRQVRNYTVSFGREISVTDVNIGPEVAYKRVTITICAPHKDFRGNPIQYQVTTIISNKGF